MRRSISAFEEPIGAPAVRLGTKQGEVGGLEKFDVIGRIGGRERDTDTDPDHDLMAVEIEWPADGRRRSARSAILLQQARPRRVEGWQIRRRPGARPCPYSRTHRRNRCADLLEQLVADGMPEGIVDILEVVEIEAQAAANFWPRPAA